MREGITRSSIVCWVAAAIGRFCRSRTISILQHIVKATKAATWSHPSALFSIIGSKLSGVRDCSTSLVGWSLRPTGTVEMPDTQTGCARYHHIAFFYRSWSNQGCPPASCGIVQSPVQADHHYFLKIATKKFNNIANSTNTKFEKEV